MKIQKPTVGRIVEISLLDEERGHVVHRPALVVSTDMGGLDGINAQLLLDGSNDRGVRLPSGLIKGEHHYWITSCHHNAAGIVGDGQVATWRYPPRCTEEIEVGQ